MANVNGVTSNSYSSGTSLYGNRNVLSGLASGMDTETMIQNSVTGYQTKITELQQSQTKLEWKQDAYRGLIDQMYNITQKYTSFTSKTNLASNAFFTNATTTSTNGTNASAVSAIGKAKSDIQINAVTKLATAARYAVSARALDFKTGQTATGAEIDWGKSKDVGQANGTMTLRYGSQNIELKFTEADNDISTPEKLKEAIEKKLADVSIKTKEGTAKASELVNVSVSGGRFTFGVNESNSAHDGSAVYIDSISGNLARTLGATNPTSSAIGDKVKNIGFNVEDFDALVKSQNTAEYLSGKSVDVTLDGMTKTVKIGDLTGTEVQVGSSTMSLNDAVSLMNDEGTSAEYKAQLKDAVGQAMSTALKNDLQSSIDKAFGGGKVTVGVVGGGLDFQVREGSGSTLKVSSAAGGEMGIGKGGVSNYFNTSNTLKDLVGSDWLKANARMAAAEGTIRSQTKDGKTLYFDADGNRVAREEGDPEGQYYRVNDKGEYLYNLEVNGQKIGEFTDDTALESVISAINSSANSGVNVSYSNLTSQFVFTARETGEGGKISFDNALANRLFGADNSPAAMTLEKFFGDRIDWEADGTAELAMAGPMNGYSGLGTISKDMSLQELFDKVEALSPAYRGMFGYNESTGTYGLNGANGEPMSASAAANYGFIQPGKHEDDLGIADLLAGVKGFTRTAGQDAEIQAVVNGQELTLKRSSNNVDMDGMSVTFKEEFDARQYGDDGQLLRNSDGTAKVAKGDAITFTTRSDADTVVDVVKTFVDDVNKLMKDVYEAYTTQPLTKSGSKREGYSPLTEEDKANMSENAINAYEEKAKTGLLFGDTDLSQLYSKLLSSVQTTGSDRMAMESIGLKTTFSGGLTQIEFDEKQLRAALDSDPDKVRTVFTKTTEGGSATNGLMASLKQTLNAYGSTSLGTPGVLVRKAGTKLSSLSLLNNNLQQQIDGVTKQIESWQTKLSNKIDYYTKQFTALEKMMSTMNNQSMMLADLMGG